MILKVFVLGLLGCFCCSALRITPPKSKINTDHNNWKRLLQNLPVSRSANEDIFSRIIRANAKERGKNNGRTDGIFLFEGDIEMGLDQVKKMFNGASRSRGKRAVIKKTTGNLWKRNDINYILSRSLNVRAKRAIRSAINEWSTTLPCMGKWNDVTSRNRGKDYMYFFPGGGCYSQVGRVGGGQRVSIGSGCEHHGIAVHEIGHAMGLWHEQSRPDRNKYVTIIWSNILPGTQFNFRKQSNSKIDSLGFSYDYNSVMHYGAKAFSRNGQPTIRSKTGVRLGQRRGLSKIDKLQVQTLYGCRKTTTKPTACIERSSHKMWCQETKKLGLCGNSLFKSYTSKYCCKTCKDCVDKKIHCGYWGSKGYCTHSVYKQFMSINCAKSCRKCRS